jgi:hypothetical protein
VKFAYYMKKGRNVAVWTPLSCCVITFFNLVS